MVNAVEVQAAIKMLYLSCIYKLERTLAKYSTLSMASMVGG